MNKNWTCPRRKRGPSVFEQCNKQKNKKKSRTFLKILVPVHFAGLLPSSDGCGRNNGPTDGFIRGRLRQPAGGSFRGNRELKRQELRVKRRLRANDAASSFGCRIPPGLQDPDRSRPCVCALLHRPAYATHPCFAFVHFNTYARGLKHVCSFSHVNETEVALLATCVFTLV